MPKIMKKKSGGYSVGGRGSFPTMRAARRKSRKIYAAAKRKRAR